MANKIMEKPKLTSPPLSAKSVLRLKLLDMLKHKSFSVQTPQLKKTSLAKVSPPASQDSIKDKKEGKDNNARRTG